MNKLAPLNVELERHIAPQPVTTNAPGIEHYLPPARLMTLGRFRKKEQKLNHFISYEKGKQSWVAEDSFPIATSTGFSFLPFFFLFFVCLLLKR